MSQRPSPDNADLHPLVARPDLVRRFDAAATRPLMVVRAPTGYGKTEALRRMADTSVNSTAWASLNRSTGRNTIWQGVLATLGHSAAMDRGDSDGNTIDSGDAFVEAFRSVAASWPRTTVLVLEDVDRLADGAVPGQVARLADVLPPNLRLVLTSRHDLPLPVGRWRMQGRVAELGPDDLRFRPPDTAALLRELGIWELSLDAVRDLTDRAEGWPAGVQLLAAAWRERGATTADVLASDEARALAEAVLSSEPTEVQDFLLATSVLGRFTAGLCRAVTGSPNAGRMLRDVAHAGLFVVPLDEEQGWFRYNRLFAELLQRELERRDPGAARGLRRRAAAWFGDQHLAPEAVRHLVDAGDLAEAFSIVSRDPYNASWGQLLGVPWNELFPADWVEHEPSRMLHFATLLGRSGHLEEATGWLQRAHDAISELPAEDPLRALLASAGALWCGVTLNARRTVNLGAEVLKRPPGEASGDQPGDFHVRVRVAMIAAYLVLDDLDQAERVCAELDVPLSTEIIRGVIVPGFRARLALRRGELHLAEELAHRVLRTAHAMGIPNHPGIREAQFALGRALAERGDLAGAEKFIERAATTADGLGWPAVASYYRIGLAVVRAAADGPEAGIAVLADLRSTLVQAMAGPEVLDALDLQEARLRIDLGELDLAAEMLDDLPLSVQANLMRIRLALAQGDTAEAYAWWTEITPSNRRDQLVHDLLGARLAAAAGDEAERDRLLMAGARAGAAEHLHRMFVDNGRELLPLLADLGGHDPHLVHLVEQVALVGRHLGPPGGGLSEREAVVLRYLASTLTHNEIANELDVSTNTVKSHVRALYRKLGVRSRSEAVAAARRRALI